ncbi:MAG: Rieske (2Fe-2S) protein [Planctomycetes bacterium]|nr:Rieske (2Fe-2S) protein [Planctomycetota bacterium]
MPWKKVCDSQKLMEGEAIELLADGGVIAIFRHQGELFAIDGICMHQGGPLARGKLMDGTVTCPWHGWQYELRTGCNAVTCKPMLKTYEIQESDGIIEIDLADS